MLRTNGCGRTDNVKTVYPPTNTVCGGYNTSSPKGNDAHLRAIIQSEKKWKHQFFRHLRAANSVVCDWIWPNFKLIQALMYVVITCKYEKDPIRNNRELELMFMKHYAPNRCLYIKVAKLRTGVGSAEMSHLQNRCLKISG